MPRITVAVSGSRQSVATLVGATAFPTGWVSGQIQADPDNTGVLKLGNSAMTTDTYDMELSAGDSAPLSQAGRPVMLNTMYVFNDSAAEQHLIIGSIGT